MRRIASVLLTTLVGCVLFSCISKSTTSATVEYDNCRLDRYGVTVAIDTMSPDIYLVFSADSMFEGAPSALAALDSAHIKASFFFTGKFLRDTVNSNVVRRIINSGHYVGPHSDRHLLLADWDSDRTPLVDCDSMMRDLSENYRWLARFGIDTTTARVLMPPYEWIARNQVEHLVNCGYLVVNPTPEILTYRDYTTPDMPDYRSSNEMLQQLYDYESQYGLNGAIIILHLGTQDIRTDKLYHHLPAIIDTLHHRGYTFRRL